MRVILHRVKNSDIRWKVVFPDANMRRRGLQKQRQTKYQLMLWLLDKMTYWRVSQVVRWACRICRCSLGGCLEQLSDYLVMSFSVWQQPSSSWRRQSSSWGSISQKSYWGQEERFVPFIIRRCLSILFQSSTQGKLNAAISLKPSANPLSKCKWY